MPQKPEAHPKHTDQEYMVSVLAYTGLLLLIGAAMLAAFGTVEKVLGLTLTQFVWIGLVLLVGAGALWFALLRPWTSFDDLTTPFYTGHEDDDKSKH